MFCLLLFFCLFVFFHACLSSVRYHHSSGPAVGSGGCSACRPAGSSQWSHSHCHKPGSQRYYPNHFNWFTPSSYYQWQPDFSAKYENHHVISMNVMTRLVSHLMISQMLFLLIAFVLIPRKPHRGSVSWMHTGGVSAALGRPCFLWWKSLSDSGPQRCVDSPRTWSTDPQTFVGSGSTAHKDGANPPWGGMPQASERAEAFRGTVR